MGLKAIVGGTQGAQGPDGEGVVTGGLTGQILAKASNTNFDTEWINGARLFINAKVDSYILLLTDQQKLITMNKATANDLTIPANATAAFPIGTNILVCQIGAGTTTIVAATDVTVHPQAGATLVSAGQWAIFTVIKIGADLWVASGDLVSA